MMNDREYRALRRDLERTTRWWSHEMGLSGWEWTLVYDREAAAQDDEGHRTEAEVSASPDRLMFTITYFLPAIAESLSRFDDSRDAAVRRARYIERIVIHELAHVMVAELRPGSWENRAWEEWVWHEERVVAQLTNAFVWIGMNGHKSPRARLERAA